MASAERVKPGEDGRHAVEQAGGVYATGIRIDEPHLVGIGPGRHEAGQEADHSADDAEARADLALEELKRAGGFERSVLVVVVPTGTGWMDPAATDTLEYLHGGDTAMVAVQYSYLTSPLSLLVEPRVGIEQGRAMFRAIYGHWTTLPRDQRPRLYVFRSLKHIYAHLVDDDQGRVLFGVCDRSEGLTVEGTGKVARSRAVGKLLAERAKEQGISRAVFDRGGYEYHGRVQAVAEGARAGGLEF